MSLTKRDNINVTIVEDRPTSADQAARMAMITSQLRTSGVNTPMVLQRMAEVARERFVPAEARGHAYIDRAIALADGGFLAAPVVQGMMLQEAAPTLQDRALIVDGGSGYLAELLRPLVASLDVISTADAARPAGTGDYTLLLVDGAAELLPPELVGRLADNARIITGLLENGVTRLAAGRKVGGHVSLMAVADIGIPVLPSMQAPKGWSF